MIPDTYYWFTLLYKNPKYTCLSGRSVFLLAVTKNSEKSPSLCNKK